MTNIFNQFIFLLFIWLIFMVLGQNFSFFYLNSGIITSLLLAFLSFKLKIIEKNSPMLFLHLNFYKHFLSIILVSFIYSFRLIYIILLAKKEFTPKIYSFEVELKDDEKNLFIASANLFCGISLIEEDKNQFKIHAIDDWFFKKFNHKKVIKSIAQINENEII